MLAKAFKRSSKVHGEALIAATDVVAANKIPKTIEKGVLDHYHKTQKILADDEIGHLSNTHPLTSKLGKEGIKNVRKAIQTATEFIINQLIYVEIEVNEGKLGEIRSIGHHYQYRWAYTSSVRIKNGKPRDCLTPTADELLPETQDENVTDIAPKKLTGARLLFGYVRNEENKIGKGVYDRLAGRIAFNHAVSVGVPDFLGEKSKGYCVPLKILGQPKSSAWEFYLQQGPENPPATYGDLPGDAGSDLAGRKFFYHQSSVQNVTDIATADQDEIKSDQATLARFICKSETQFKFAIRFSRLRSWELGALLATLQPHRLFKQGNPIGYAHKLGLGRPLGMGSVRISECRLNLCEPSVTNIEQKAIQDLVKMIGLSRASVKEHVLKWLKFHTYRRDNPKRFDYPRDKKDKIHTWHTNLQRKYSQLRRQNESTNWQDFCSEIDNFPPD